MPKDRFVDFCESNSLIIITSVIMHVRIYNFDHWYCRGLVQDKLKRVSVECQRRINLNLRGNTDHNPSHFSFGTNEKNSKKIN